MISIFGCGRNGWLLDWDWLKILSFIEFWLFRVIVTSKATLNWRQPNYQSHLTHPLYTINCFKSIIGLTIFRRWRAVHGAEEHPSPSGFAMVFQKAPFSPKGLTNGNGKQKTAATVVESNAKTSATVILGPTKTPTKAVTVHKATADTNTAADDNCNNKTMGRCPAAKTTSTLAYMVNTWLRRLLVEHYCCLLHFFCFV